MKYVELYENFFSLNEAKLTNRDANKVKNLFGKTSSIKSIENVVVHKDAIIVAYTNYSERANIIKAVSKLHKYDADGRSTNAPKAIGIAGYNWIAFVNESINEGKLTEMRGLSYDDAYKILDIAAGYTSTQDQAANQMWSDAQDLYDYLKSDHIAKRFHKKFYKSINREFPEVTENLAIVDTSTKFQRPGINKSIARKMLFEKNISNESVVNESFNPYDNILSRLGADLTTSAQTVQQYLDDGNNKKTILGGQLDGDKRDDKVSIKVSTPRANQLKPSQSTVYPDQSIGMLITAPPLRDQILSGTVQAETMFVSSDGYIIDGHHRWSATYALNPKAKLVVTQINLPIKVALPVLNAILRATNTPGQGKSGRPGKNVFQGASKDDVHEIISDVIQNGVLDGQFMPPKEHFNAEGDPTEWYKFIASKLDIAQSWKEIPYIISANINKMNKPAKFFGARDQMPQIPDDPSNVKSILKSGIMDIKPPLRSNYAKKIKNKPSLAGEGPK